MRGPVIAALARTATGDIERAAEALKGAEHWRIHTFISTSDVQRESHAADEPPAGARRDRGERDASPKGYTEDVEFSAQDATRTELDFLLECFRLAVRCGATTINVPDTVGYATPTEFGELVRIVREDTPDHVVISTHCHNDLGLAVANALAGIENGARQVEVAVNGIGERAGNCSLEEIAMIVRTRREHLGVQHGLNIKEITRTSRLVRDDDRLQRAAEQGGRRRERVRARERHPPARRAGQPRDLRDHGPARDRAGGQPARARQAQRAPRVRRRARRSSGITLDDGALNRAFTRFKDLADRKVQLTDQDLSAIVAEELGAADEDLPVSSRWSVGGGTHLQPRATVRLRRGEETIEESAIGDGLIDAAMGAIARAAGVEARLVSFHVSAVTGGTDALGDVVVQLDVDGRRVTGPRRRDRRRRGERARVPRRREPRARRSQAKDDEQTNEVTP